MLIGIWRAGGSCNHTSPNVFIFKYKLIQCHLSIFMPSTYNYWKFYLEIFHDQGISCENAPFCSDLLIQLYYEILKTDILLFLLLNRC